MKVEKERESTKEKSKKERKKRLTIIGTIYIYISVPYLRCLRHQTIMNYTSSLTKGQVKPEVVIHVHFTTTLVRQEAKSLSKITS